MQEILKHNPNLIIYIDESGFDRNTVMKYGFSLKNVPIRAGKIVHKSEKRVNVVAGLCGKNIIAPFAYYKSMNADRFNLWFAKYFLPNVQKGSVIVMDNARFHQKRILHRLAQEYGCILLFLPPYSPELNPIENYWAILKSSVQKLRRDGMKILDALKERIFGLCQLSHA